MKNKISKITIVSVICLTLLSVFSVASAQTVGAVTVQTNSATNISNYQATLNGYLSVPYISNSNYVYFQWGTTTNYTNTTNQQNINSSNSFSQVITGLSLNTTYHFMAVVQSNNGTYYGQDMTFYTNQNNNNSSGNYYVQTNYPTYVQNNSATLNGTLSCNNNNNYNNYSCNSNGAEVWFQWGTDTNYGSSSFQQSLSSGTFIQQIANLNYNTTYHFRAVAQINGQITYGQDMTFNSNGSNNNNNYNRNKNNFTKPFNTRPNIFFYSLF